jgi:Uma2 family endonuclease
MSIASSLITAAEFAEMPDPGHPQELVRGVIVDRPPSQSRHGLVCGNVFFHLRLFVEQHRLGRVFCNDTGVITERDPDSVRGADVMFISFAKLPAGAAPQGYVTVPPDAVFEVRSPSDRWKELYRKIAEYLSLGAAAAYLLDPDTGRVYCFYPDREQQILERSDEFVGVGVLDAFRLPVSKFFE